MKKIQVKVRQRRFKPEKHFSTPSAPIKPAPEKPKKMWLDALMEQAKAEKKAMRKLKRAIKEERAARMEYLEGVDDPISRIEIMILKDRLLILERRYAPPHPVDADYLRQKAAIIAEINRIKGHNA